MDRITQPVSVGNLAEAADQLSANERLALVNSIVENEDSLYFVRHVLEHAAGEHERMVNIETLSDEYLHFYELR